MSDYTPYCSGVSAETPQNEPGSRAKEARTQSPRLKPHTEIPGSGGGLADLFSWVIALLGRAEREEDVVEGEWKQVE